jgi:AcrR family transcriptional regulator
MENVQLPKRRGRPRSFRMDEVAAKAAHLFWRHGYEGVSVDELTTAMGITTQSFYAAFGSKEQLHRDALAWYEREITRPLREALTEERDLALAVRNALELAAREFTRSDRPLGCMRSTAGLGASRENEAIARRGSSLRLETTVFFKARLDRGIKDGQLGRHSDTEALAVYLNVTVVGMAVAAQDGVDGTALLAVARMAASTLRTIE